MEMSFGPASLTDLDFLGPIELVGRGVVAGRLGPADDVERGVTLLDALGVVRFRRILHLLEQVVVVDLARVVVLDVAAVLVADEDGPIALVDRAFVLGEDHAEDVGVVGVVPDVVKDLAGVFIAEEPEIVGEIDLGETVLERDGAGLPFERRDERHDLFLGQMGRFIGAGGP
jgi:hypothetical protein